MKNKSYSTGYAINFHRKEIILSRVILLALAAYSNPAGENPEQKADSDFLPEKPAFLSFAHSFKNNQPEEASNAGLMAAYFCTLCANMGSAPAKGGGKFSTIVRRYRMCMDV